MVEDKSENTLTSPSCATHDSNAPRLPSTASGTIGSAATLYSNSTKEMSDTRDSNSGRAVMFSDRPYRKSTIVLVCRESQLLD